MLFNLETDGAYLKLYFLNSSEYPCRVEKAKKTAQVHLR